MKPDSEGKPIENESGPSETEFTHWQIPDVTVAAAEDVSNLFGRRTAQKIDVEEAQSILPPTLIEIEEIREQAEQEGFAQGKEEGFQTGVESGRLEGLKQGHEEGLKQGIEQGLSEGLEQAKVLVSRFESLLEQFEKPLALLDTEIEQELVSLTMKLARAVIGNDLKTHPEHVLAALRLGVDSLPLKEQGISIRLHPDDYNLVQELYSASQLEKNRWELESDPSLAPGDCVINSQRSSVDMRLEHRITTVLEEMTHHLQHLNQSQEQQQQALPSHTSPQVKQNLTDETDTESEAQHSYQENNGSVAPQSEEAASAGTVKSEPSGQEDTLKQNEPHVTASKDSEGVKQDEQSPKPATE
ncbi:flagellar assembly protein FliH [Shewanella violacea]|uniref:Flagellar assembly protein FliH n=1 Tax=Shewanella violacea (strain JCM 10179 / CIP 106290 / LMG 19151 / DSS12) TaxID=637905 RepID=D4ZIA6_SHEVD|nr:flagellar assembly protein FliH [Shewanella violacea]BAJ01405.1 flagellar assembly protein FliH [Shewanella violacea DSS12]